jgi:hypothetical protein
MGREYKGRPGVTTKGAGSRETCRLTRCSAEPIVAYFAGSALVKGPEKMKISKIHYRRLSALQVFALAFLFFGAAEASAQQDADLEMLAEYRLTDDGLANFAQASRNVAAAVKADPSLEDSVDASDDATIAELAALYDSYPAVRKAIESADMTSTEYVTFLYSMIQAGMAAWVVEEYGQTELPEGTPQENVDYYLANKDKFTALSKELQASSAEEAAE